MAIPIGMQRMSVSNVLGAMMSLVKIGATVAFLELGHGLRGLVYANAIVTAVFAVAGAVIAFTVCPWLRVAPWRTRQCYRNHSLFVWKNFPAHELILCAPWIIRERLHQTRRIISAYRTEVGLMRALREWGMATVESVALIPHALRTRRGAGRRRPAAG